MDKKWYRGTAEQIARGEWDIMEEQAKIDIDNELLRKHAERYIIIRKFLLHPEIEQGFYHGQPPKSEEEVDAAVDRFISWVNMNSK